MKNIIIIVLCLGLVACAVMPQSVYISPKQRQQALLSLSHWRAEGAISLVARHKRQMLSFNWQQEHNDVFNIRFSIFTYSVQFSDDHGHLTVDKPGQRMASELTDTLLPKAQFWLRGLPAPVYVSGDQVIKSYDSYGRLTRLVQNGWVIYYQQYAYSLGSDLPKVIIMSRPGVELRILISNWQGRHTPSTPSAPTNEADVMLLRSLSS